MSALKVSGKVVYGLPNNMGFGGGDGVAGATVRVFDQDPSPIPPGQVGGLVPGTATSDALATLRTQPDGSFQGETREWDAAKEVIVTLEVPPVQLPDVLVPTGHRTADGRFVATGVSRQKAWTPRIPQTTTRYLDTPILTGSVSLGNTPGVALAAPLPDLGDQSRWTFPPVMLPVPTPDRFTLPQRPGDPTRAARRGLRVLHYQWAGDIRELPWLKHCAEVAGAAPQNSPLAQVTRYFGAPSGLNLLPPPPEVPGPLYMSARVDHLRQVMDNERQALKLDKDRFSDKAEHFRNAYIRFPVPASAGAGLTDEQFAQQRLAGVHATMISRVARMPAGFKVTDAHLRSALGDPTATLNSARQARRLYLLDYAILDGLPAGPDTARHLPAPFALFCLKDVAPDRQQLVPVAIQVHRPGTARLQVNVPPVEVFTPDRGDWWEAAKLAVQAADLSVHELKAHLFETHLCMEPLAVAAFREFDFRHPVGQLLAEHFRDMIFQMYAGRRVLINPGGGVDELVGVGLKASLEVIARARKGWRFDTAGLRADLGERGLLNPGTSIADYPYRDDGLLLLGAIEDHVGAVVDHYYLSDADVVQDVELQAWHKAVEAADQGNLPGVPRLDGRSVLKEVLSQIVYTCTAQHAAVNFPQYEYTSFAAGMPAALYAQIPRLDKKVNIGLVPGESGPRVRWEHSRPDRLPALDDFLPPIRQGIEQLSLAAQLGGFQYGRLGMYASTAFGLGGRYRFGSDPDAHELVARFRQRLVEVGAEINSRNAAGRIPYTALLPGLVPNSINV